jgi:protein-disulfide isomerase
MHVHRSLIVVCFSLALAASGGGSARGPAEWEACRNSAEAKARVQADVTQGLQFAVPGTPTLVVNGTSYFGLPPTQNDPRDLMAIVTDAIRTAQSDAAVKNLDRSVYYDQGIVAGGVGDMPVPVGAAPVRGPSGAWVTIVEFSDFQCPFCRNAEPTIEAVLAANAADVRLVYKEFPLTSLHENAMPAALAADCANQQGKFWEMHDLLMKGSLDDGALVGYAEQLGLK